MAASLRTPESVLELSGVDKITMPPSIIEDLKKLTIDVHHKLNSEETQKMNIEKVSMDEKTYRWMVNEDEIGNEKLSDGIRIFARDLVKLENIIKDKLVSMK